jgi:hypothetical protein
MSADNQTPTAPNPEETFNDLLTYAELLNTPRLARLYIYILQHGPVEIEIINSDLEMAHSTTYKYIGQLEEMGLLSPDDDVTPTTVTVTPIRLQLGTKHGDVLATPTLVDAVGRHSSICRTPGNREARCSTSLHPPRQERRTHPADGGDETRCSPG